MHMHMCMYYTRFKGGVLSEPSFFFRTLPSRAHTSSHMSGHHLATLRRAGRKRGARFESSEALSEQPAVVRSAVELHGCCARVSLAEALLSQHIDGVTRAGSAGTKSGSRARSLVLLTMLAPVSRCARLEDQLGLDDEVNSEIVDRYYTGSSARHVVAVCDLPASSVSAPSWSSKLCVLREHPPYSLLERGLPRV